MHTCALDAGWAKGKRRPSSHAYQRVLGERRPREQGVGRHISRGARQHDRPTAGWTEKDERYLHDGQGPAAEEKIGVAMGMKQRRYIDGVRVSTPAASRIRGDVCIIATYRRSQLPNELQSLGP